MRGLAEIMRTYDDDLFSELEAFSTLRWSRLLKSFHMEDRNLFNILGRGKMAAISLATFYVRLLE